jgi:hypothetical protein
MEGSGSGLVEGTVTHLDGGTEEHCKKSQHSQSPG